jgi:hypothetical protein
MSAHGNITNVQLARLGVSQAQLSAYCGVNINKISPWLAATRDISNLDLEKIISTIENLFRLEAAAEPWPIDFRNVPRVKALLERLKAGEFDEKRAAQG